MIALDTHSWIWWVNQSELLSANARNALHAVSEKNPALISSISVWELHMLVQKKRLVLRTDATHWVHQCELSRKIRFVPIDNEISRLAVQLPRDTPDDPADRFIIATALSLGASLITKDSKIRSCHAVKTIW